MIKTIKIMLIPNNKQKTKLSACAGTARFAYNWTLDIQQRSCGAGGKFVQDDELRRTFTRLKEEPEYAWLKDYSNNITKQAIKDACTAYKNFFAGRAELPKFKSRKKSKPSFYADTGKIRFTSTHVKLEKLTAGRKKNRQKFNWVKLAEKGRIPIDGKYYNPRITFDGLHWFISVGIEYGDSKEKPKNKGIGIDLGIRDLAICSESTIYININKTREIKRLKKKKRRVQRQISRKYEAGRNGNSCVKTNNIKKAEKQLRKIYHRLSGIRNNYLHQTTAEIISRKPRFIVLEDLNIKGMMKNRYLSEAIAEQNWYEFRRQAEYKAAWHNIKVIIAKSGFASSRTCSSCGEVKKDLKLRDRVYQCPHCGLILDRDYNAALNLYQYGKEKTA